MTDQREPSIDRRILRWAHSWAAAASEICETIETISMPESPATEIGRRDAMSMVLVGAVRNVVRGAELAVGENSEIVMRFSEDHPTLKTLRDRLEICSMQLACSTRTTFKHAVPARRRSSCEGRTSMVTAADRRHMRRWFRDDFCERRHPFQGRCPTEIGSCSDGGATSRIGKIAFANFECSRLFISRDHVC